MNITNSGAFSLNTIKEIVVTFHWRFSAVFGILFIYLSDMQILTSKQ